MINIVSFRIFKSMTFRLLFNIHLLFAFYFGSKKFICSPSTHSVNVGTYNINFAQKQFNFVQHWSSGGGGGGTSRRDLKIGSFPNLFVDDCRNSCSDRLFRSFRLSGEQQFTLSLSSSQIQSINKIIIINVFICHKIKTTNVMLHIFHSKKRN